MARCIYSIRTARKAPCIMLAILTMWMIKVLRYQEEKPLSTLESDPEIHLAVVACQGKTKTVVLEATTMIKSAIIFSKAKLRVHLFTDELQTDFKLEFSRWPKRMKKKLDVEIYPVEYPLSVEETTRFREWWGPCSSFRLFLPEVLQHVDSVIYVDTDVIFLTPVDHLWNHFSLFDTEQVGGLAPRVGWSFKVPKTNPNFILKPDGTLTQVNSGVFLMNLTRMRERRFSNGHDSPADRYTWNRDLLLPMYFKHKRDMFGDQNLINTVFHFNHNLLYLLPCKFNYQHKFCFDRRTERTCDSAEKEGAAVIHGSANTFYNNYSPAFAAINNAFRKYNFEDDIESYLLRRIVANLKDEKVENHEHCGGKIEVFVRGIQSSLKQMEDIQLL